jgi:DNA-binding SARP family transcriptional activator
MTVPLTVRLLGGLEVTRGGRQLDLPSGQARDLVKVVACAGGRVPADAAVELLWPDVDPDVGANRLRTVLNRLRQAADDLVVRDEGRLRLGAAAQLDIVAFERDAREALALSAQGSREAVSAARAALARYRGDLLPEDPYEPWTAMPRERLRRHALSLLDICAADAAAVGDLDDAVRWLNRASEIAPYEEERYLTSARHLLTQGRRGAARAMVGRAREVLDELGVDPPASLRELERRVRQL